MEFINKLFQEQGYLSNITYPMIIAGVLIVIIIIFLISLFGLKVKRIKFNIGYYIIRSLTILLILFIILIAILILWKSVTIY